MNTFTAGAAHILLIGIGATAVMDAWLLLLQRLGVPTLNFAMIGRWVGHWRNGTWTHDAIANALWGGSSTTQPASASRAFWPASPVGTGYTTRRCCRRCAWA